MAKRTSLPYHINQTGYSWLGWELGKGTAWTSNTRRTTSLEADYDESGTPEDLLIARSVFLDVEQHKNWAQYRPSPKQVSMFTCWTHILFPESRLLPLMVAYFRLPFFTRTSKANNDQHWRHDPSNVHTSVPYIASYGCRLHKEADFFIGVKNKK